MTIIVANDFPPHHGGIQRMMSRLATELKLSGRNIIVVAPQMAESTAFDAAQPYRVSRYSGRGRLGKFLAMLVHILRVGLESSKQTIIADSWFPAGLAVSLIRPFLRARVAVLAYGTEIAYARRGIRLFAMRYVFARADRIIAVSGFTSKLLVRAGITGAIHVVSPGVDPRPIIPARSGSPTIISVGRLVQRKGFDTMIRAMPTILKTYPAAQYEIVGSGPQRELLERLVTDLNVRAHVTFLGPISDDELAQALGRAWLFSLPVRAVDHDVEGFGIVYLEAALAELAAIGGANSGAEEAIVHGDTGLIVDGTSTEDVAAAVIALLSDPKRAQRMGTSGKARAIARFTWTRSAAEMSNILSST